MKKKRVYNQVLACRLCDEQRLNSNKMSTATPASRAAALVAVGQLSDLTRDNLPIPVLVERLFARSSRLVRIANRHTVAYSLRKQMGDLAKAQRRAEAQRQS